MNYEQLIEAIQKECKRKGISGYRLSLMSSIPLSTIYGVFHHKNKAQIDTVCMMLDALGMHLIIMQKKKEDMEEVTIEEAEWLGALRALTDEKRELIQKLITYLKE